MAQKQDLEYMKKLAFDIGANVGQTIEMLKPIYDKIVAFEANPDLAASLKNKHSNNSDIIIESLGVSNVIGQRKFHLSNCHLTSTFSNEWIYNSRFAGDHTWNEAIDIPTTTLDEIINKYGEPDFIKIDVEGHEYEVFQGLTKLLENTCFAFEWAEELYLKVIDTINHLKSLGYTNFAYTDYDSLLELEMISWSVWENLTIHNDVDPQRKGRWGMIYFKK